MWDRCEPSEDGKRRDAQDVSEGEKIRTNECGRRRMSAQEEQKRK